MQPANFSVDLQQQAPVIICGILKSKLPDADSVSFGPTIRGAHSPTERLRIDTVTPFWRYLRALLAEI